MSRHKIIFFGTGLTESHQLECYQSNNKIIMSIDTEHSMFNNWVILDKETAIKLSRVLKAEISKIKE